MAILWYILLLSCIVVSGLALPAETVGRRGKRNTNINANEEEQVRDKVTNLPEQPKVGFEHFAGYIKVRPQDDKALFYWFFEAEDGVSQKPLVLWLNGGPGCSSVAFGAAQELGPFLVQNNSKIVLNEFSWNKAANVLFLESPVGVGFSYTNKSEDIEKLGDQITAVDSYDFLIGWFKRFPQFKSHDFYIAGESYAGHYAPQLANIIYDGNKRGNNDTFINLKGFLIGNAVINDPSDQIGLIDYAWSHAIISDQLYNDITKNCDFKSDNATSICSVSFRGFLEAYSDIDIYNIYGPVCLSSTSSSNKTGAPPKLNVAPRFFTRHDLWHKLPSGYDPCAVEYVQTYFSREDVQKALHANVTNLSYPYTPCSNVIKKWNDSPDTVLPILQKLLDAGLRIWIFSGDADGRVPVTSTRYSIKEMGGALKIKQGWRSWFHKQQVGGWVESYENGLTFLTVRGAGHQVPLFAPDQSLSIFSHFLSGSPLPSARF
ncbi:hypothetical protein M9H77_09343 [Catharanthus roseus]|uniref:Uncharacterized protein n=1 Tax=Catharanthus roseus TaxID=4058 RepID=A0ACC0C0Q3_CATRO|nr:hypothetical protein M9H77_09343 [Catharanthus roseus]